MTQKPTLWITRKLSDKTMARVAETYEVIPNPEDGTFTAAEIIEMSDKADAILPCHSEIFDTSVSASLSDRVKIIANHSVGVDHCDLPGNRRDESAGARPLQGPHENRLPLGTGPQ